MVADVFACRTAVLLIQSALRFTVCPTREQWRDEFGWRSSLAQRVSATISGLQRCERRRRPTFDARCADFGLLSAT